MKIIILTSMIFAVGTLVACAAPPVRKIARTPVQQKLPGESFTYTSRSEGLGHDADDADAEAKRIGELEYHLRDNRMCPRGYTITSRRVIVQMGERDQIAYGAQCTT